MREEKNSNLKALTICVHELVIAEMPDVMGSNGDGPIAIEANKLKIVALGMGGMGNFMLNKSPKHLPAMTLAKLSMPARGSHHNA
jgi:hypothetical protein